MESKEGKKKMDSVTNMKMVHLHMNQREKWMLRKIRESELETKALIRTTHSSQR